ncbi:rhodanese [Novosphingobium sp. MMS21-SN21R]|uniref:rhodanese n=1 Tax=Novosphingobium sp. MMS21-SN21R TaxID=2969298 RepID=UPI0028857510|nr:rhodanese [Novosphingobium sp. MMS21-SN21R]MDT0510040.1 rhodanese [Novosphingobium sp. MMS21-SN21R]
MRTARMVRILAGLLALTALTGAPALAEKPGRGSAGAVAADFDSDGYRAARYRAPVDRAPHPARRIVLGKALRLHATGRALFIDVLPVEGGYRDRASGVWRLSQPHATIPGAQWHPETGRTAPDPLLWTGLARAVAAARKDDPRLPVVLFCRSDCWMGWNAARRLGRGGVGRVYWLAEGIDGWNGAGRALVDAAPVAIAE